MSWKCPKCGRSFERKDQSHYCVRPSTVDEYIALQDDEKVRNVLGEVRRIFSEALPEAEETISWSMPTYRKGRNIIHFAASKNHLGIYPGDEATSVFGNELSGYDTSKGTIRIPWDMDLPEKLLKDIARWCYDNYRKDN